MDKNKALAVLEDATDRAIAEAEADNKNGMFEEGEFEKFTSDIEEAMNLVRHLLK